jgi:hypothetical protein
LTILDIEMVFGKFIDENWLAGGEMMGSGGHEGVLWGKRKVDGKISRR